MVFQLVTCVSFVAQTVAMPSSTKTVDIVVESHERVFHNKFLGKTSFCVSDYAAEVQQPMLLPRTGLLIVPPSLLFARLLSVSADNKHVSIGEQVRKRQKEPW